MKHSRTLVIEVATETLRTYSDFFSLTFACLFSLKIALELGNWSHDTLKATLGAVKNQHK